MKILKKILKLAARGMLLGFLFIASFLLLSEFMLQWRLKDFHKFPVTKETISDTFPVLVITRSPKSAEYHARTLLYRDLKTYLAKQENYTFLVPAGMDEQLNAELEKNSRASKDPPNFDWDSIDPWWAYFEAKRLSDERQYLEVYHTWDDDRDNTGWYEATANEIYPKYHQHYFGPSVVLLMVPVSFLITCALWIAFVLVLKLRRRRLPVKGPLSRGNRGVGSTL